MRKTLTPTYLDSVKPGPKGRLDVFDAITTGLLIRVTAGKKTWSYFYSVPGTKDRARVTLGTYPATGLDEARKRAVAALALVEAGIDPRAALAPAAKPKTVAQLHEERMELEVRGKLRSAWIIEWRAGKYILPLVGDVAVQDFRIDPDYNRVIDPIVKRGKLRMAGQVHTDLVTLMNFGISRGVIEYSRIAKTKSKDPKNVRERNLTPDEIKLFWGELPKALVRSKNCQRILQLCLVTGQRLSEVAGMQRGEFNWNTNVWTIPADRVKNGKKYGAHAVPLSALAASIVRDALAVNSNKSDWLFPNEAQNGPLVAHVIGTTLRRAIEAKDFTIPQFTAHDLRRTVGTQMLNRANGLGITKHEKYLVLNHQSALSGNVSDTVYDQNDYLEETREALDKWGAFLGKLVGEHSVLRRVA